MSRQTVSGYSSSHFCPRCVHGETLTHAQSCLATENQTQPHGGIEGKIALNGHTSLGDIGNTTTSTYSTRADTSNILLFFFLVLSVFFYKFGIKFPFLEVFVATISHFYAQSSNIS